MGFKNNPPPGGEERKDMKIRFKGKTYLLIGDLSRGGAITTRKQYENFEISFAHLYSNGDIIRYGQKIGTLEDIKVISLKES